MVTRVVVTADTHVPDFANALPRGLERACGRADLILHAGDVTSAAVLERLSALAPVLVALGNNDRADVASFGALADIETTVEDVSVAMVHDAGPRTSRERRLGRRFPHADLVVFGHSHIPMITELDGHRFLNPGSPTWKRRQPTPTYAAVTIDGARVRARILDLA